MMPGKSSGEERIHWNATESHLENMFFASFYIVVFIIAVPANALVLWFSRQQRSTSPSRLFLMNLAVADLSYMMILPIRATYHLMENNWVFGEIPCRLVGYLFYLNMYCSLYFMAFISLDRLLAVLLPLRSLVLRRRPVYACVLSAVLWLILVISMLPMMLKKPVETTGNSTRAMCSQLYLEKSSSRALVSTAVAFALPSITMVTSYLLILHRLWTLRQPDKRYVVKRSVTVITLVLLNFAVAFIPYHVNRFIFIKAVAHKGITREMSSIVLSNRVTSSITCLSGVLDPFLYFFLSKTNRKPLLMFFCRSQNGEFPTTA